MKYYIMLGSYDNTVRTKLKLDKLLKTFEKLGYTVLLIENPNSIVTALEQYEVEVKYHKAVPNWKVGTHPRINTLKYLIENFKIEFCIDYRFIPYVNGDNVFRESAIELCEANNIPFFTTTNPEHLRRLLSFIGDE